MKITSAEFIISNSDVKKCPNEPLPEYAFIGRSNVGKSSLINMLTGQKKLAKTSARPGKTQLINHFKIKLPKEFSLENFIRLSNPIYDLMKNLLMQNIKLREARDILLPKLMNGQIEV